MEGIIKKERIIVHNKEEEGRKEESASLRIWGTTIHFISYIHIYSQLLWFLWFDFSLEQKENQMLYMISWILQFMTRSSENKINYHSYTVIQE